MAASQDEDMPLTLPDTQNVDEVLLTQSQEVTSSRQLIWGRLCPNQTGMPKLEMLKDSYTLGRHYNCDIYLTTKELKPKWLSIVSKVHFRITREIVRDGSGDNVVHLEDFSHNGTFVNKVLVGKGRKVMLTNNDTISLGRPFFAVYIYMSTSCPATDGLPPELRVKYTISRTLGSGVCGEVKLIYTRLGCKRFAMKTISKKSIPDSSSDLTIMNDPEKIMNEVKILKALRHPCIIRMEEIVDTPSCVYIVLELMEGGELFDRIRKDEGLPEKIAKLIFYQVALAVNYLHECGITHRDLKPENILLADNSNTPLVKVSDFGLSKFVSTETMMRTFCGTPMYVAPEILLTGGKGTYTSQVDVWSLGVILYVCLTGYAPFSNKNATVTLQEQIIRGSYRFSPAMFAGVSTKAIDLIKKMMTTNPAQRIKIKEVLSHPWLQDRKMREKVDALLRPGDENDSPINQEHTFMNPRAKRTRLE